MVTEPRTARTVFAVPDDLAAIVRDGTLDPELAALLSMTIAGGIPLVVGGGQAGDRRHVRDGLLALVPPGRPVVPLAGADEDFAWMPEAGELGWRRTGERSTAASGAVMVATVEPGVAGATWGEAAHLAIRALTAGYSLMATAQGSRLEDVLAGLSAPPVSASEDEVARLGVVLLLGDLPSDGPPTPLVSAAHYLRPVARDPGGHIQRMAPAVLATRARATGRFDHFAWGVLGELAARTGVRPLAFEREQAERAAAIAAAAVGSPDAAGG